MARPLSALVLVWAVACGADDDVSRNIASSTSSEVPTTAPTTSAGVADLVARPRCPMPTPGRFTFERPGDGARELMPDAGFEGKIGSTPVGFAHVEFGGASYRAGTETTLVHGGAQAYWYERTGTSGGARIYAKPPFELDHTYAVSLFARADAATKIRVSVMGTLEGQPVEQKTVAIGPGGWSNVSLHVVFPKTTTGSLWIEPLEPNVRIVLDDVSVRDVSDVPDYSPVDTSEIAASQFGLHVNKWGVHAELPDVGQGLLRFSDTGTGWRHLQPARDQWSLSRLTYLLGIVDKMAVRPEIVFELGFTPEWAALDPSSPGAFGAGSTSAPANIADYTAYVTHVATTFKGKMSYWELWNEYNQPEFWRGSQSQMIAMGKAARDTLRAIDPANRVLSPSVTVSRITDIANFLDAGGADIADVITFHAYFRERPEMLRAVVRNVRRMMKERGVDKPLWNTEGGFACDPISMDCTMWSALPAPTDAQLRGAIARSLIVQRAEGVTSFAYYMWDRWRKKADGTSGEPKDFTVSYSLMHEDFKTPTVSGIAYRVTAGWLTGARFTSGVRHADGTFVYGLARRDGSRAWIAWNPDRRVKLALDPTWHVTSAHATDGGTRELADACSLEVDDDPVLLDTTAR